MNFKKLFLYSLLIAIVAVIIGMYLTSESGDAIQENNPSETHHGHSHDDHEHSHDDNRIQLTPEQIQQMGLEFRTAGPGNLVFTLSTRGKIILHPDRLAHIIPKVSGVAREAIKNIGNFVHANELMAVLESREMAEIKASYLAALSKKKLAASSLQREDKLFQEKVSAGQDYLNAKNVYEESTINVQLSRQKLRAFGLSDEEITHLADQRDPDLRLYQIRSPLDGTVIMRHITLGEFVENTTTIYEVADLSRVWVDIGIYPKDLYKIKEGQMVEIVIPLENKGSQARLIYVSPIVDEKTITAKAVAELENPEGFWRPGVFVNVNIAIEEVTKPIVISKDAVQNSEGKDFVFLVKNDGIEKQIVNLGLSDDENVEILSGLKQGEKYVANKTFLLKADLGKGSAEHEH